MKFELTQSEKAQLDRAIKDNLVNKWITAKASMNFEVGDVLLKYRKGYGADGEWKPENIASDLKMPQRYVYIFEDEHGIGYIKPLKVSDGKLGKELLAMTEFNYDHVKFEVDPEYAEHVLLDSEFSIKEQHKKSMQGRKQVAKMNRKIGVKPTTISQYNDFFSKLKPEDKFWTTNDFIAKYPHEYVIKSITKVPLSKIQNANNWDWRRFIGRNPTGADSTDFYEFTYTDKYNRNPYTTNPLEISGKIFYLQEPVKEEDKR